MITFFHGADAYRLRRAVADAAQKERTAGGGMTASLDAATEDGRTELERALKYPAFLGERKIVVVGNILADADTADTVHHLLERYQAHTLTDIALIAYHHTGAGRESAATKKLTAFLKSNATVTGAYEPLRGTERDTWVRSICAARGCAISPPALSLVIGRAGHDSWALALELEKLCAYAAHGRIEEDAVRALIPERVQDEEFALSNALTAHDKRGALAALWRRLQEGTSGHLLLGTVAHAVRTLRWVGDLAARRTPSGTIAATVGLPPFVVAMAAKGAMGYRADSLRNAHGALARLDRDAKDGRADIDDGLFSLIIDM